MPKPKKLIPRIISRGKEPELSDLDLAQRSLAATAAGISLSRKDWKIIERSRRDFHWCLWAKDEAIEYKRFERRLTGLSNALQKVLTSFGSLATDERSSAVDRTGLLLWHEISNGNNSFPSLNDVLMQALLLRAATRTAINRTTLSSKKDAWQHDWDGFVGTLASIFENHGIRPTAANTSARHQKPSAFVSFAFEIMKSLPNVGRRHTHSSGAMSKAISGSLVRLRRQTAAGRIASLT